jgi:hypothetical protein
MPEQAFPPGPPGGDEAADELANALREAAKKRRDDPDANDIAADDAGGSTVAED